MSPDVTSCVDVRHTYYCFYSLARFLKARDWQLVDAEMLMKQAVEWRRKRKPLTIQCKWCHQQPGYHSMVSHDISVRVQNFRGAGGLAQKKRWGLGVHLIA